MEYYWSLAILLSVATLIRSGDCAYRQLRVANLRDMGGTTMRVHDRYWLDYDSVAFALLVIALGC